MTKIFIVKINKNIYEVNSDIDLSKMPQSSIFAEKFKDLYDISGDETISEGEELDKLTQELGNLLNKNGEFDETKLEEYLLKNYSESNPQFKNTFFTWW